MGSINVNGFSIEQLPAWWSQHKVRIIVAFEQVNRRE
jgi:hypothetical protein